jgi:hypothetical protein
VAALLGELIPLAHAGHWLASLAYALPVLIVGVALFVTWLRERREPDEDEPLEPSA